MTTPGDESRTELAWREIVEHYGDRVLPDDATADDSPLDSADDSAAGRASAPEEPPGDLPDHLVDDDEVEIRELAIAESERFRPPPPPPLPTPRTWQRGVSWAGVFGAPVLAVLLALLPVPLPSLVGWVLFLWFVGGFGYLVRDMPRAPRDPWDDGSRI